MVKDRAPRKELLPLAPTQLKIVAIVSLPLILTCVVVSFWQTYFFLTSLGAHRTDLARQVTSTSVFICAITLLVMVPVFILVAIWVSYHIVGPMRRLAAELTSVGEGHIRGAFLMRKGDELTFVAEAVTQMEKGLNERVNACRKAVSELEEEVGKIEARNPAGETDDLRKAVAELRTRIDGFSVEEVTSSDK